MNGSVLVDEQPSRKSPLVYFAAGRSSHIDSGILLYGVDLKTGKLCHKANVTMTRETEDDKGIIRQRALPDILSIQRGDLFMRDLRLDRNLTLLNKKVPHLYAPAGFLDKTWWHRTCWMYGTTMMSGYGGWPRVGNTVPAGRILVFDGKESIYGYSRMSYRAGAGHVRPDATKDYKLFAESLTPVPQPQRKTDAKGKRSGPAGRRRIVWSKNLPFLANSIVLTQDALLVAGGKSLTESAEHHGAGKFWIVSRRDGTNKSECEIPAPPIPDGMAFTEAGIFISTIDGSVLCLGSGE